MGWLRSFIRSRMNPIPIERAAMIKRRLSMVYLFFAWNAFALGLYFTLKEDNPVKPEEKDYPSKYYARLLRSPDAKVLRYDNFKLVDEYNLEGMERPVRGRTREEREREAREKEEREREEIENKERESLNLLVEETNSL